MIPCRCTPTLPVSAQTLCADCMAHRVGVCAGCRTDWWWRDLSQVGGQEWCPECVAGGAKEKDA